eukprot:8588407-Lingulodinium_polyedra.AAC.1
MGHIGGVALATWPVKEVGQGSSVLWELGADLADPGEVGLAVVDGWEGWEVMSTEWLSPLQRLVHTKGQEGFTPRMCLRGTGKARPVLVHAAEECFGDLTLAFLHKLERDQGIPAGANLFEVLSGLCRHILGCSDEALVSILSKRAARFGSEAAKLLACQGVEDALGEENSKEVQAARGVVKT